MLYLQGNKKRIIHTLVMLTNLYSPPEQCDIQQRSSLLPGPQRNNSADSHPQDHVSKQI